MFCFLPPVRISNVFLPSLAHKSKQGVDLYNTGDAPYCYHSSMYVCRNKGKWRANLTVQMLIVPINQILNASRLYICSGSGGFLIYLVSVSRSFAVGDLRKESNVSSTLALSVSSKYPQQNSRPIRSGKKQCNTEPP